MNFKVYRKPKKDNLYVRSENKYGEIVKIIIVKKEVLERFDEDEDYWNYLCCRIEKMADWDEIRMYLMKNKFDYCRKVKIYDSEKKNSLKKLLASKDKCFVYNNIIKKYVAVNLIELRKNEKLYKKFANRYCYYNNYNKDDSRDCADYYSAGNWFVWFVLNCDPIYILLNENQPMHNDIRIGCVFTDYYGSILILKDEPKMDYSMILI